MKKYLIGILVLWSIQTVLAQKPVIMYLDKTSGPATETVDIIGTGFSNNSNNLKVYFGAVQAPIISSTESLIRVKVPSGGTYDNIKVTNLVSKLSGVSNNQFLMSFGGETFLSSKLTSSEIYYGAVNAVLLDFCHCDIDSDGKTEWIMGNDVGNGIYISRNASTPGNISTTSQVINLFTPISYITCGDVNNDGKPDIIAVRGGNTMDRIFVLTNTSSGPGSYTFSPTTISLLVPNTSSLGRIMLEDLDNDGLPEIIITDNTNQGQATNKNAVHIFKNTSSNGSTSFQSTPITLIVQAADNITGEIYGLDVNDLNGDGYPEIVISSSFGSNICVFKNTSFPGSITFNEKKTFSVTGPIQDIKIAEINGDNKPDIILSKVDNSNKNFSILINQTGDDGVIKFGPSTNFTVTRRLWSLDVGDINGDGKTDIVFSSIDDIQSFSILINTTANGVVTFNEVVIPANGKQKPIRIADIDNDGRPDITLGRADNRLEVFLNKNCVVSKTKPSGSVEICTGTSVDISTVKGINLDYTWKLNNFDISGASLPVLSNAGAGDYTVTITSDNGDCSSVSPVLKITTKTGSAPIKPTILANNPACMGANLQLTGQNNGGGVTYEWAGPNGWTSTQQNPVINNVRNSHAGYYTLQATSSSGCKSKIDTMLIQILSLPVIEIAGSNAICGGTAAELSVAHFADHTYQWKFNNTIMPGKTSSSISVDQIGSYNAIISKEGCSYESSTFNVESIALPQAAFQAKNDGCVNEPIAFNNTSTIPLQREVVYKWDFGDGTTSNLKNPTHAYEQEGTYQVNMEVAYKNTTCISDFTKSIVIRFAEPLSLTASDDIFCHGDSVILEIQGTFPSYEWSNGKKTKSIYANTQGTYTASIVDATGCTASGEITVSQFSKSEINIITEDGQTVMDFGKSLQLIADDQYIEYTWSPAAGLSDTKIYNPIASPRQNTRYTVTVFDDNGCKVSNTIELTVNGNAPKLATAKIISPNGDSKNEYWEIEDIASYEDNEVAIFDGHGKKVFSASPYQNNWNGTFNGTPLVEGIYYFVLTFKDTGTVQTGSIMIVR